MTELSRTAHQIPCNCSPASHHPRMPERLRGWLSEGCVRSLVACFASLSMILAG